VGANDAGRNFGLNMKIDRCHLTKPMKGISKQYTICLGSSEKNVYSVGIYLQRPKWITNDATWEKLVNSIQLVDFPVMDLKEFHG
jgi:hypothetical protein